MAVQIRTKFASLRFAQKKLEPAALSFHHRGSHARGMACGGLKSFKKSLTNGVEYNIHAIMNIQIRVILKIATLLLGLGSLVPNEVTSVEFKEAKGAQVCPELKNS